MTGEGVRQNDSANDYLHPALARLVVGNVVGRRHKDGSRQRGDGRHAHAQPAPSLASRVLLCRTGGVVVERHAGGSAWVHELGQIELAAECLGQFWIRRVCRGGGVDDDCARSWHVGCKDRRNHDLHLCCSGGCLLCSEWCATHPLAGCGNSHLVRAGCGGSII